MEITDKVYTFVNMIETRIQANRKVRDAKIKQLYAELKTPGTLKTAVAEVVAEQVGVSLTTVNRVINN